MNLSFKHLIPEDFDNDSRVWIYQSNRLFSLQEALTIETILETFISDWKSHGAPVKGFATMFFGQFIIIIADEKATGVSGCSTDGSVRMIKSIGEQFNIDLFNRQLLAFVVKDKIQMIPMSQLDYAFEHQFIAADTLYFNNTVTTKIELMKNWLVPVEESWLKGRLGVSSKL
jgi:hypothetical protein